MGPSCRVFSAVILSLCAVSAVQSAGVPSHLDSKDLLSAAQPDGVIDNHAFVPGPSAQPARAPLTEISSYPKRRCGRRLPI